MQSIDSHQHFWKLSRGDYAWLTPALAPLYRDFLPQDLAPNLAAAKMSATILVQAAPTQSETSFLLQMAKATAFVAGVVGWVDLAEPQAPNRLAELKASGEGYFKGVRPMLQDMPDPDWILSPSLDAAFRELETLGLSFDALVRPQHLRSLLRRLERHPELKVVIDHAAKPAIAAGEFSSWSAALSAIAMNSSALCKLSGLVTEAGNAWSEARLAPYVEHIIETFGAHRVMWGSDWPVVNLTSSYADWHTAAHSLLANLSMSERRCVFGDTAAGFYAIQPGARPV